MLEILPTTVLRGTARNIFETRISGERRAEIGPFAEVGLAEDDRAGLAESLDHAFEDVNERIWTETKLKSEEMLAAVGSALRLVGDQIDILDKGRILQLADEVRTRIRSHETSELKQANEALDSGTQNLAALVVEKAMADAGRRDAAARPESSPMPDPRSVTDDR